MALDAIVVAAPAAHLAVGVVFYTAATTVIAEEAVVRVNIPTPLPNIAVHVI